MAGEREVRRDAVSVGVATGAYGVSFNPSVDSVRVVALALVTLVSITLDPSVMR
jgi:hypothetical protein